MFICWSLTALVSQSLELVLRISANKRALGFLGLSYLQKVNGTLHLLPKYNVCVCLWDRDAWAETKIYFSFFLLLGMTGILKSGPQFLTLIHQKMGFMCSPRESGGFYLCPPKQWTSLGDFLRLLKLIS